MASTPHTAAQRAAMQAERTALLANAAAMQVLGRNTSAAAAYARARELKEVVDRESPGTPLT